VNEVRSDLIDSALAIADVDAPVSGRLTEPGGAEPGEPLDLLAIPVDGSGAILGGTSALDGRFNLFLPPGSTAADLTAEPYELRVVNRLAAPAATFTIDPSGSVAGLSVAIERGITATGRLTGPGGAGVRGAQVALTPIGVADAAPVRAVSTVGGGWTAAGLQPGSYRLAVRASSFATHVATVTVPGSGPARFDAVLGAEDAVTGVVRSGGAPIAASVTARRAGSTEVLSATTSAADGTYHLGGLASGDVTITAVAASGSAHTGASVAVDRTLSRPATVDLDLAATVDVTGTVVDGRSGEPVAGAHVVAQSDRPGVAPKVVTTGTDGSFTIVDVPPTTVTVIASKDGRSSSARSIDAATHASDNELSITEGHRITGTVRDAGGDPVPGIEVQANGRSASDLGGGLTLDRVADGTTDGDGRFDLAVPAADTYDVAALDATVAATVADGSPDPDVDLVTNASIVRGTVKGSDGSPVADVTVHLLADGDEVAAVQTGADGTYAFAPLGGRSYDVWVADSRVGLVHRTVAAPASGAATAADLVPGPASVAVDLAGPSGAVGGTLALIPDLGGIDVPSPISLQVAVPGSGNLVVPGLDAGTYHSMITSPGLVTARPDLQAAPTPTAVPVTLVQGGSVAVTVREADGSPLAAAEVDVVGTDPAGTGSAGVSGMGGTDADGKVVVEGLVPGTYDIWAIPTGRPTMLVASGVVVTAPASVAAAAAPTAAATAAPVDGALQVQAGAQDPAPAEPWKQVESTYATAEDGHYAVGRVEGANGTGFGANPPQVTLQTGANPNFHVPVTIDAHGSFNLQHLPDGPLRMTVTRPGTQPRTFLFNIPGDLPILKLQVGLPLDAKADLGPDEPTPPLPGYWETFSSLFDTTEPEPLTQDPMMRTILAAQTRVKRCPSSDELLRQAKRNAQLAAEQVLTYDEELEGRWNEWWNRAGLFTIQALNSAGTIVSAFVPIAQLYKGLKVGLTVIDDPQLVLGLIDMLSELAASPVPGAIGELVESLSRDVTSGDFDGDQVLSVIKVGLDSFKFALEKERDKLLLLAKQSGGLVPQAAKVLRVVGQGLSSLYGLYDGVNKAFEAYSELQNEYQAIKDFEDGADQARVQVRKLEQKALHLYALWLGQENGTVDCDQPKDLPRYGGGVGAAVDPNEIQGPAGEGADRWLAVPAGLGYEVHFENLGPGTVNPPPGVPLATSPAAQVRLTQTIPATFDRSSFTFDDLGWGTHVIDVPDGVQSFTVDEPITVEVDGDPVDLVVRVTGDYDPGTGKASWDYRTLDPETGEIPLDPAKGFLPPEPGDETGQGWARYSISGAADVAQGTYLDAQVAIVFDTNDPIDTNTWRNRVGSPTTPGGVCPSTDTADGRFLCALYPDVLGRAPDAAGKAYWSGRLARGTTRHGIANQLLGSTEGDRTAVRQTFDQYLGRAPDPAGLAYWVGRMQHGATRDTLRQTVLASSEYLRSNGGTRAGFVDALYEDVYGRGADGPGRAHWVASLAAGRSRSSVAGRFLFAPEGRRAIVRDAYDDYLGRSLSYAEADYWAKRLLRTKDEQRFRAEVLGSNEYFTHA
jgi:protocatechuate 3,4-dioxygenase beta subunit